MDFINRNFYSALKLIIGFITVIVFIRIIPWLVVVGGIFWAFNKCVKLIRTYKEKRSNMQKKVYEKSSVYSDENSFDFPEKKVIDVEYEEIKK